MGPASPRLAAACLIATLFSVAAATTAHAEDALRFATDAWPVIERHCTGCHNPRKRRGDVDLTALRGQSEAALLRAAPLLHMMRERVAANEMPPPSQPRPDPEDRMRLLQIIDRALERSMAQSFGESGVIVHRLSAAEYDNSVRDLLNVDLHVGRDLLRDEPDVTTFEHATTSATIPSRLTDRYRQAADRIAAHTIVAPVPPPTQTQKYDAQALPPPPGAVLRGQALVLEKPAAVQLGHDVDVAGTYSISITAVRERGTSPKLALRVDDRTVDAFSVVSAQPQTFTSSVHLSPGPHRIEADLLTAPDATAEAVGLGPLAVTGPLPRTFTLPPSHLHVLPADATAGLTTAAEAQRLARARLMPLMRKAHRRDVNSRDIERVAAVVDSTMAAGGSLETGMQKAIAALLMSPGFVLRAETTQRQAPAKLAAPLEGESLANRLAHFLWSSLPDEALLDAAAHGALNTAQGLEAEARRMLADPRARALADDFAARWLHTDVLADTDTARLRFPQLTDELRAAMVQESAQVFTAVLREDLPVRTFLDASFTYLNGPLARHYGIPGVTGLAFRRVTLPNRTRGGLVTQAATLTVHTSEAARGTWILEALFGESTAANPSPLPPENTPTKARAKTPACAGCHAQIDELGLALQAFDALGAANSGAQDVEALKDLLLAREPQFRRTLAVKLLAHALGRMPSLADAAAVEGLCARTRPTLRELVIAIVKSEPFRRGPPRN